MLGAIRLSRLKALDIDRLYTKLRNRGLAPVTIRQVRDPACLVEPGRTMGSRASQCGQARIGSIAIAARAAFARRRRGGPIADGREEVDPRFGRYVRVMVATGARRAEVRGLRWSDDGLDAGVLTVERSYSVVPGVRADRPTKTRSARKVVLDPVTLDDLAEGWRDARELAEMCGMEIGRRRAGYIFAADPTGAMAWRPDTANAQWVKACDEAGLGRRATCGPSQRSPPPPPPAPALAPLGPTPHEGRHASPGATGARQPARRHPPRMPPIRHPLRRTPSLGTPPTTSGLTSTARGVARPPRTSPDPNA